MAITQLDFILVLMKYDGQYSYHWLRDSGSTVLMATGFIDL